MKVVIVGGVAGGATAATRIRRLDEEAEIIIFERSGYISYANCGLPYYIGEVIEDREKLTVQSTEGLKKRFNIDAKVYHEVLSIDPKRKTVKVKALKSGLEYEESYDRLILSTGAKPVSPVMEEGDTDRVFTLRTVEDTLRIKDFIDNKNPETAVVIGGGYIGIEVAENLVKRGIKVTMIQRSDQLMKPLDYDMASIIDYKLRENGIDIEFETSVEGLSEKDDKVRVGIKDRNPVITDMVIYSVGVVLETTLAGNAGLKLGVKGAVEVNDMMQTSEEDIYAVGDSVQIKHMITGKPATISLAGPANKQGRIAADNICGYESHYKGSLGSSVIKIFDLTVATTGLNQKACKSENIDYEMIVLSPQSHAGYYPNATTLTMKVIYEKKTLRILGAQIIGYEGVDKRIDVIATAICAGLTADGLKDLDLAYAPPYSSAKDPVNMAGFMIDNIEKGCFKQFHWNEIDDLPADGSVTLLDARTPGEYQRGHIEGFINIPVDELRDSITEIPKDKPVYVMCQSGLRSYIACRILAQEGYNCYNLSGGYRFFNIVAGEKEIRKHALPCGMEL